MSTIAKSQSLMRALRDNLQKRLPSTYVFSESLDAQGSRLLISADATPATTEQVCAIRIKPQDQQFNNVIGQSQLTYTPMIAQVIEEATAASATVSLLTLANKSQIDQELMRMSVKQERYINAAGTVPAVSQYAADGTVTGSTLATTVSPDLYWPLSGQ